MVYSGIWLANQLNGLASGACKATGRQMPGNDLALCGFLKKNQTTMLRTSIVSRFLQRSVGAARRTYTTTIPTSSEQTTAAAHKLAQEALAQKTGVKHKATLPKGDKKPAKASGEKDSHWKAYALSAGALTGAALGGLFYYGKCHEWPTCWRKKESNCLWNIHSCFRSTFSRRTRGQGTVSKMLIVFEFIIKWACLQYAGQDAFTAAFYRCKDRYEEFKNVSIII